MFLFLGSSVYAVGKSRLDSKLRRRWEASGDFDVWPFFRREEFYEARRNGVPLRDTWAKESAKG
jgi:hypothetical protein